MRSRFIVLGAAVSMSACFALTDDISGIHGPPTVTMSFDSMFQHHDQRFEFVVVDDKNFVQTRGIVRRLDPLVRTDGRFRITVPLAVPRGASGYRVDFWADENGDGIYEYDHAWENSLEFSRLDHSWRVFFDDNATPDPFVRVTHTNDSYDIAFSHHLDFVDLNEFPDRKRFNPPNNTGADAVVRIDNLGTDGKLTQIRIADPSGHVVGLFRFRSGQVVPLAGSAEVELTIPGCVEPQGFYDVDLYVDANDNNDANGNGYDDPSGGHGNDLGWRLLRQPAGDGNAGLHVTFNAADTATGNVNVGPP